MKQSSESEKSAENIPISSEVDDFYWRKRYDEMIRVERIIKNCRIVSELEARDAVEMHESYKRGEFIDITNEVL